MDSDNELDVVEIAERHAALEENAGENINEERIVGDSDDEVEEVQRDEADADNEDGAKRVKPKKAVKNPQPKLNLETLKTSRGLTALPALFAKQSFKGKGHEESDLNIMLKTYEYWCHRLYPKLRFDQCIEKIETLGNKKPVNVYLKKIRMGLVEDEQRQRDENDLNSDDETQVAQQVENQIFLDTADSRFDDLLARPVETEAPAELTEEQKEIISVNRERALKLRQERLRKIREQAEAQLNVSSVLPQSLEHDIMSITALERELQNKTTQVATENLNTNQDLGQNSDEEDADLDTLASQVDIAVENLFDTPEVVPTQEDEEMQVDQDKNNPSEGIGNEEEIGVEDLLNVLNDDVSPII